MTARPAPDPSDPGSPPLLETAARVGQLVWMERHAFAVLSDWSRSGDDAEVAGLFGTLARHHTWRAEQLGDRFPVLAEVDLDAHLQPPSPGAERLFAALDETGVGESTGSVARLAAVARVLLPYLVVGHGGDLDRISPVADGPLRRTLRMVISDEVEDWRSAEAGLRARLVDEATIRVAADVQVRLESLLV